MIHPPRPPAFSPGFVSFLWGLGLGVFIWVGLLAVGVSSGTAFLLGLVAGILIFFFVRLFGVDQLREERRPGGPSRRRAP